MSVSGTSGFSQNKPGGLLGLGFTKSSSGGVLGRTISGLSGWGGNLSERIGGSFLQMGSSSSGGYHGISGSGSGFSQHTQHIQHLFRIDGVGIGGGCKS